MRKRLSIATMVIAALAMLVSMLMPAQAQAASYSGPTTTVAWKLAPGITDLASLRANRGAMQTYYGKGAPKCTPTGKVGYQVDTYKYDAKHKPLVDKLVAGGVNYLAPKTPNDAAVYLSAYITKPPMCQPDKPKPVVKTDKEQDQSCDQGVRTRTKTVTTDWVWSKSKAKYVPGKPVVSYSDWKKERDLSSAEKAKLGCKQPDKPKPVATTDKERDESCENGVRVRTKTVTTDWVWNVEAWAWVKGEPVVVTSEWEKVRDLNPAEKARLGCAQPDRPDDAVVSDKEYVKSCEYGLQVRTITTTTKPIWNEKAWKWLKGKPVVTYSEWAKVRDLTSEEKGQYGCGKPNRPKTTSKVVDTREWNDCKAVWRQDRVQTIRPEWSNADWKWVAGQPTYSFSKAVKVRNLTAGEKEKYGCVAKPATVEKVPPKAYPVQAQAGGVDEIVASASESISKGASLAFGFGFILWITSFRRREGLPAR